MRRLFTSKPKQICVLAVVQGSLLCAPVSSAGAQERRAHTSGVASAEIVRPVSVSMNNTAAGGQVVTTNIENEWVAVTSFAASSRAAYLVPETNLESTHRYIVQTGFLEPTIGLTNPFTQQTKPIKTLVNHTAEDPRRRVILVILQ